MASAISDLDGYWMRNAIQLALRGTGKVSPNPRVGCVVVHNGTMIGQGWHEVFGGAHAEVNALRSLDVLPADTTIYVTLEPCSHVGKTPPCVDLLVARKPARVVIGTLDPNPLVSGKGMATLVAHDIDVVLGVEEEACRWVNRSFIHHITSGTPYITLKMAQSLDGIVASESGAPLRITGAASETVVHELRSEYDAVLVGAGTVVADNPRLNVRLVAGRNPTRIIADRYCKLTELHTVVTTANIQRTIVVYGPQHVTSGYTDMLRRNGVVAIQSSNFVDALTELGSHVGSILCEGGISLARSLLKANCVQELLIHLSPNILGKGLMWWPESYDAVWKLHSETVVGSDLHLQYLPLH